MKGIFETIVLWSLGMLSYLYYGFVLTCAWSWLIVPNSTMPEISQALAVGAIVVAGIIKQPRILRSDITENNLQEKIIRYVLFVVNLFLLPSMLLLSAFALKFII